MSLLALKENPIYKVNHLSDADTIAGIHVFYGTSQQDDDLDELFKRDPQNPIFVDKIQDTPYLTVTNCKILSKSKSLLFFQNSKSIMMIA